MGGDVLSCDNSRALAQRAYQLMTTATETPFLPYAEHVAELSHHLLQRYVDQAIRSAKNPAFMFNQVEIAWHVGLLHAVISSSYTTFEDIMDVANMEVARNVVLLTPDLRLPYPRRVQLLYNGLHAAQDMLKLVQLAERTMCLVTWLSRLTSASLADSKAQLSQLSHEMVLLARLIEPIRPAVVQQELAWCASAVTTLYECARKPDTRAVKLGALRAHPISIPATCWAAERCESNRKRKS